MAKTIDDSMSSKIEDKGILLGTQEPTRESKGAWGELYFFDDKIYFLAYTDTQDAWLAFIEELEEDDKLEKYLTGDDLEKVIIKLKKIKNQ